MQRVKNYRVTQLLGLPLIFWVISCSAELNQNLPTTHLSPGSEREIAYTDKGDAFWVTRSGGYNNSPWHGLTAAKRGYLEDLFIYADGELLPREQAEVTVDPVSLHRDYPQSGVRETWTLLDDQRTLMVQLEADAATHWTVQPAILGGNALADFDISTSTQELNVHFKKLAGHSSSYPYMKIWYSQPMEWLPAEAPELTLYNAFLTQRGDYKASHRLVIVVALNETDTPLDVQPTWIESARSERYERVARLMEDTRTISNQSLTDQSIAWAHNSLNALVMKQMGKGIYAGLPWFDDYWGRDAFISFAGGTLVNGGFEDAREILLSFAQLQNIDTSDPDYGRVPNRAQPENIIYNTTDGTPWFVRSVWDYYRYTGDDEFLKVMWPAIRHATLGSLMNWVNPSGILRHADADTWMDAKGPDGPWSPRGDRAIDIQFIWRDQLEISKRLALKFNEPVLSTQVSDVLVSLENSLSRFRAQRDGHLVDHLNVDDSQDTQVRPNVFLVPTLFEETCDWATFSALAPQLVTRRGVLSLAQTDSNFHPYHHQPGLWVQDAAYHNGIIWTWNSAATISQAIRFHQYHYAKALFEDLTHQLLNRGAIGTIAELTDAWPKNGAVNLSGTFSQAWSLAEYLRVYYQDILGVQPDLSANRVKLAPRLLEDLNQIMFKHPVGTDTWKIEYTETPETFDIQLQRANTTPIELLLELRNASQLSRLELTWEQTELNLRYEKQMGQWTVPGTFEDYRVSTKTIEIPINSLAFCEIDTTLEVPALQGPRHRLLSAAEVATPEEAGTLLLSAGDDQGDDKGLSGNYVYPSNSQFEAGIADILEFSVWENQAGYEFEMKFSNLVDPGWHPEYGYQLTYCSIGISHNPGTGTRDLGKNSKTNFQANFKADQIMYLSGGLLLVDASQEPVAEYMPLDPKDAIGSAKNDLIRFSLPKDLFNSPLHASQFQIAVGCQDDHGGAGIGDYRAVEARVGEWTGGGKTEEEQSNIYDWLLP